MVDIFDTSFDADSDVEVSDNIIVKGGDVNLTEKDPTMSKLLVGVGWDLNAFDVDTLDLDLCCFLIDKNNQTRVDEDFVFYNNMSASDGAVVHNGDNITGAGDGDDETISIDINGLPFDVIKVVFIISIYKGAEKEQAMSSVRNAYIRLINSDNSQELLRYKLNQDVFGSSETAMLVASLNREGPKWHFEAVGSFPEGGIEKIATDYGIIVHTA